MKRPQKKKKGGRPTSKGALQAQRHAQHQQKYGTPERTEALIFDQNYAATSLVQELLSSSMPKRSESYENSDLFERAPVFEVKVKEHFNLIKYQLVHPTVLADHNAAILIGLLRNVLQHRSNPDQAPDLKDGCDFSNIILDDLQEPWKQQYNICVSMLSQGLYRTFIAGDVILPIVLKKNDIKGGVYRGYLRALQQNFDLKQEIEWCLAPENRSARNSIVMQTVGVSRALEKILNETILEALKTVAKALLHAETGDRDMLLQIAAPDFDPTTAEIKSSTVHVIEQKNPDAGSNFEIVR